MEDEAADHYDLLERSVIGQPRVLHPFWHGCSLLLRPAGPVPKPSVLAEGVDEPGFGVVVAAKKHGKPTRNVKDHARALPP